MGCVCRTGDACADEAAQDEEMVVSPTRGVGGVDHAQGSSGAGDCLILLHREGELTGQVAFFSLPGVPAVAELVQPRKARQ